MKSTDQLKKGVITHEQMINDAVRLFGADPKKLKEFAEKLALSVTNLLNFMLTMVAQKIN